MAVPFIGNFWALVLGGAAVAFGSLSLTATSIANDFSNEGKNPLSWFTVANLEAQRSSMINSITHGFDAILGLLGGVVTAIGSFLGFKTPEVPVPTVSEPGDIPDLTQVDAVSSSNSVQRAGGIAFMITEVLTYTAGAFLLTAEVNKYTDQQEQLVSGT